jgi:hypothetical protein
MNVDMCTHIVSHGSTDDTPFVLINTPTANAYTCSACAVAWIEAMNASGARPSSVVKAVHADRCSHTKGNCPSCVEALLIALSNRFRELASQNKTSANRLLKIKNGLSKRYGTEAKPLPPYPGLRRTGRGLDAAMAGQRYQADRAQRLSVLRPPSVSVVVVHKSS